MVRTNTQKTVEALMALPAPLDQAGSWSALSQRERLLAQREQTLAQYAAQVTERSAAADTRISLFQQQLKEERAALESRTADLEKRERAMEARLKAVADWEEALCRREARLHLHGIPADVDLDADIQQSQKAAAQAKPPLLSQKPSLPGKPSLPRRPLVIEAQPPEPLPEDEAVLEELASGASDANVNEEEELTGGSQHQAQYEEPVEEDEHAAVTDGAPFNTFADEVQQSWAVEDETGRAAATSAAAADQFVEEAIEDEALYEEDEAALADDWMAVRDEASDRVYYWNRSTGETAWQRPGDESGGEAEGGHSVGGEEGDEVIERGSSGTGDASLEGGDAAADGATEDDASAAPTASLYRRKLSVEDIRARSRGAPPGADADAAERRDSVLSQTRRVVVVAPSDSPAAARLADAPTQRGFARRKAEPKWARESAALRDALAAARRSARDGAVPPPPDDANDGRVECPHCKRRFNAAVAERHIPQCQNLKTKPRMSGAKR